jgi:hypothetical protein
MPRQGQAEHTSSACCNSKSCANSPKNAKENQAHACPMNSIDKARLVWQSLAILIHPSNFDGSESSRATSSQMITDIIQINDSGVTVFGFSLGVTPTIRDFELAFKDEALRTYKTEIPTRETIICGAKGLSWLNDLEIGRVLCLDISLGPVHHRKALHFDPSEFFRGKVQIGPYTVRGPFSFETGEIVQKVQITGLGILLIPDEKGVQAIMIAFQENERRLKNKASF